MCTTDIFHHLVILHQQGLRQDFPRLQLKKEFSGLTFVDIGYGIPVTATLERFFMRIPLLFSGSTIRGTGGTTTRLLGGETGREVGFFGSIGARVAAETGAGENVGETYGCGCGELMGALTGLLV